MKQFIPNLTGESNKMKPNIYQIALDVQDASNLSGVLRTWAEIQDAIWEDVRAQVDPSSHTRKWSFNQHPVNILFANKVHDLTQSDDNYSAAYHACKANANQPDSIRNEKPLSEL